MAVVFAVTETGRVLAAIVKVPVTVVVFAPIANVAELELIVIGPLNMALAFVVVFVEVVFTNEALELNVAVLLTANMSAELKPKVIASTLAFNVAAVITVFEVRSNSVESRSSLFPATVVFPENEVLLATNETVFAVTAKGRVFADTVIAPVTVVVFAFTVKVEVFDVIVTVFDCENSTGETMLNGPEVETVPPRIVLAVKTVEENVPECWVFPVESPPLVVFGCATGAAVSTNRPRSSLNSFMRFIALPNVFILTTKLAFWYFGNDIQSIL
jgi:hypothetical protein